MALLASRQAASRLPAAHRVLGHATGALLLACGLSEPTPPPPIQGTQPEQFSIVGEVAVRHHPDPDSAVLIASIAVADSGPHIRWVGTNLRVESDQGYDAVVLAIPNACLEPKTSEAAFPLNFAWLSCNRIGVETESVAVDSEVAALEERVTGRTAERYDFLTQPGQLLVLEVPVGREATSEAIARARELPIVRTAYRISTDPECVRSDVVPRPACPAWSLFVRLPYALGESGDSSRIPLGIGGWLRASYLDAAGNLHVTEYSVP